MFKYAKSNMALVNVYIDAPFAKMFVVDEKMSVISFIAQVSKTGPNPSAPSHFIKLCKRTCCNFPFPDWRGS
jgi:hypothetical protein